MSLFNTGIRPHLDKYLTAKSEEVRDYGNYWGASSAGYCMRLNILKRLKVPVVPETKEQVLERQWAFESGHILHGWLQAATKNAGISLAQELELQDEDLMVRGHFDDLLLVDDQLLLLDYKTQNSVSFGYQVKHDQKQVGHYHKMQLGTYMYMLRKERTVTDWIGLVEDPVAASELAPVTEGHILKVNKKLDSLETYEQRLTWSPDLEKEIVSYWKTLQGYWNAKKLPACTCLNYDGGFMGKRSSKGKVYGPYFYNDTPCSLEWVSQFDEFKEFISKGEK